MYHEKPVPTRRARAIMTILALLPGLFVASAIFAPAPAFAAANAATFAAAFAAAPADASAPDSGAPARDPFLAPAPVPLADSGMPADAPTEAVKLSTQGRFTDPSPRV